MRMLFELMFSFFKVGLFTFGGGYAMLPMLQREIVEKQGWTTEEELMDCFAISQCTPGVIAVNTATFVGMKRKGVAGAIFGTVGIVLPSLLIIMLLVGLLQNFAGYPIVVHALAGIRVAVAALVLRAVIQLFRKSVKGAKGVGIFAAVMLLAATLDISPAWFVLGTVAAGVLWVLLGRHKD